jgi:gluconate 2-dehydrogenase gamma chain
MQRREFVEQLAGTTALGVFGATLLDLEAAGNFAAVASAEQSYEFLKPEQVRLLDAVTAQIVPTDDTPGAREAHVVRFIDRALATFWQSRRPMFATATTQLETFATAWKAGNTPFVDRITGDQVSILQDFERAKPDLFRVLRNMTMAGMFSHPEHGGNFGRVGWKMIGYEPQYSWVPPFGYYDR